MFCDLPKQRYICVDSLDDLPPFFEQSYDCERYTIYNSDLDPNVEYYILKDGD